MNAAPEVVVVKTRAKRSTATPTIVTDPDSLTDAIAQAIKDPKASADKLATLTAMYERREAKAVEAAFNDAMCLAQAEMRPIATDADNDNTRSKYATYAALDRALRPIYTRHGIAISYNTGESRKPDHILVFAYVSRGGFTRTYEVDMPNDGGEAMTKRHATGAGMSYGMRYLLRMIFNVAVGEDDNDGNGPAPAPATPPKGFEKWTAKIEAAAGKGAARLQKEWAGSAKPLRDYAVKYAATWWVEVKSRAATAKAAA